MRRVLVLVVWALAAFLAACSTSRYERDSETSAALPQAQGLGAFAGACLFFCSVEATFTQRDNATPAPTAEDMEAARVKGRDSVRLKNKKGPAP